MSSSPRMAWLMQWSWIVAGILLACVAMPWVQAQEAEQDRGSQGDRNRAAIESEGDRPARHGADHIAALFGFARQDEIGWPGRGWRRRRKGSRRGRRWHGAFGGRADAARDQRDQRGGEPEARAIHLVVIAWSAIAAVA